MTPMPVYVQDDVLKTAAQWRAEGRDLAFATVVSTWGSSPRPVGSQLLVDSDGNFSGSVSGGCVEGAVVLAAVEAIRTGEPEMLEFGVSDNDAWEVGLACGGTIQVYVDALQQDQRYLEALLEAASRKQSAALLTILDSGAKRFIPAEKFGADDGDPLLASIARAVRSDRGAIAETPEGRAFIQIFNPPLRLLVVGAVHIAQVLAPLATLAGYAVTVIDPRRAFASSERFPGVAVLAEWPHEALPGLEPDQRTAVVTLAHDPKIDDRALIEALRTDAFYIGSLGSKRTHARRLERLSEEGCSAKALARIHGPVGLDINARSPAEIGVSILAEMTGVLRKQEP